MGLKVHLPSPLLFLLCLAICLSRILKSRGKLPKGRLKVNQKPINALLEPQKLLYVSTKPYISLIQTNPYIPLTLNPKP